MQLMKLSLINNYQSFFSILNFLCIATTIIYSITLFFSKKKKNILQKTVLSLSVIYILIFLIIIIGVIANYIQ